MFKSLIYVASILGNALLVGPDAQRGDEARQAVMAAIDVADTVDDDELRCIAHAKRAQIEWNKADDDGKRALLAELRALRDRCKPQSNELEETINELDEQYSKMNKCAQCGAADAAQRCARCHLIRYCSRDCQQRHWADHKPLCQKFVTARDKLAQADSDAPEAQKELLKSLAQLTQRR